MENINLSNIFLVGAHLVMVAMVVYIIYFALFVSALKNALFNECEVYENAFKSNDLVRIFLEYLSANSNGLVTGFYKQYRTLIDVKGEQRTIMVEVKNLYQLLAKPDLIVHFVNSKFNMHMVNASYLGSWGISLGMLFTIASFVIMGFSDTSEATVTSSLTALTTTGIGCLIGLIADSQKRKLCLMVSRSQNLIEAFITGAPPRAITMIEATKATNAQKTKAKVKATTHSLEAEVPI
jgi:hypothetical protein